MQEPAPIQRHEALVSYSTEHQYLLLLIWKITHGLSHAVSAKRISAYIIYAYNADVRPHFWDEEANLFTLVRASDPLRIQAEAEHRQIHEAVVAISKRPGKEERIRSFVDLLQKHIHFEELTFYKHLQEQIPDLQNQIQPEMIVKLKARTPTDPDSKYPDLFWMDVNMFKQ